MPVNIRCPQCRASGSVPDAAAGKQVKCPKCQSPFVVSASQASVATSATTAGVFVPYPVAIGGAISAIVLVVLCVTTLWLYLTARPIERTVYQTLPTSEPVEREQPKEKIGKEPRKEEVKKDGQTDDRAKDGASKKDAGKEPVRVEPEKPKYLDATVFHKEYAADPVAFHKKWAGQQVSLRGIVASTAIPHLAYTKVIVRVGLCHSRPGREVQNRIGTFFETATFRGDAVVFQGFEGRFDSGTLTVHLPFEPGDTVTIQGIVTPTPKDSDPLYDFILKDCKLMMD